MSGLWLKMTDSSLRAEESKVDEEVVPLLDYAQRCKQLRVQRRRAMRRAMSLERTVRALLDAAISGTAEDVTRIVAEAKRIVNIPLHEALKDIGESE